MRLIRAQKVALSHSSGSAVTGNFSLGSPVGGICGVFPKASINASQNINRKIILSLKVPLVLLASFSKYFFLLVNRSSCQFSATCLGFSFFSLKYSFSVMSSSATFILGFKSSSSSSSLILSTLLFHFLSWVSSSKTKSPVGEKYG